MRLFSNSSQGKGRSSIACQFQFLALTASLALLSSELTQAATTTTTTTASAPSNSSVAKGTEIAPDFFNKLSLSYFGIFYGPSLGNPSNYQPDDMGRIAQVDEARIAIASSIALGYKITPEITAGPSLNFNYYPVFPMASQAADVVDPMLKVAHSKLIHTDRFNLAGDLRAYLPVSTRSQSKNLITAIRSTQNGSFEIPNSRFTLGVITFEKIYFYGNNASANAGKLEVYFGPYLNYQLSKRTALNLTYEMNAIHRSNEVLTSWAPKDPTDLILGLSIDVTSKVNLNPYLQIYPGGKINLDATQFGAYLSASIL